MNKWEMNDRKPNLTPHVQDEQNPVRENRVRTLLQMSSRRQQIPCPNVDEEWEAFRSAHRRRISSGSPKLKRWHIFAAVLSGAAVALLAVFLVNRTMLPKTSPESFSGVVALGLNTSSREVILEEEGEALSLQEHDSISFLGDKIRPATKIVAKAVPATPKPKRLSTPRGMDFKVILPDGSEVLLNAESTIEFPSTFMSGERRVQLEGEAYFKVAQDAQSPFIVSTGQMDVRVLGTEFNLKSYSYEPAHVALVEGSLEVMSPGDAEAVARLEPGREAWRDAEGQFHVQDVDVYAVTQWVKGFFYFDDSPLVDVLRELGRWYNLGVVFHNPQAMAFQVHFSALRRESVDVAIESLNRLRKFKVKIEEDSIVVY